MTLPETGAAAADGRLAEDDAARCEQCGSSLAEDQEWCLECGAARTLIHRPPDWRLPAALVGAVVILILLGLTVALIGLSNSANREAAAIPAPRHPTTATGAATTATTATSAATTATTATQGTATRATTSPATTTAPAATSTTAGTTVPTETTAAVPGLSSWPIGLSGWTVVLALAPSETAAQAAATRLEGQGASDLGLLESSQHPAVKVGPWVIFTGRYPTSAVATGQAESWRSRGFTTARAELVGQAGG